MPNTPATAPAEYGREQLPEQPQTLQLIVQKSLEEKVQGERADISTVLQDVEKKAEQVNPELKKEAQEYVQQISTAMEGNAIGNLEDGTAGLYDGSQNITIDTDTLILKNDSPEGIKQAVQDIELIVDHENVHKDDKHHQPLKTYAEAQPEQKGNDGPVILQMGGKKFTHTSLKEGVAVSATGVQSESGNFHVSTEYVQFKSDLEGAIAVASARGITLEKVRTAMRSGDITQLDDRTQKKMAA